MDVCSKDFVLRNSSIVVLDIVHFFIPTCFLLLQFTWLTYVNVPFFMVKPMRVAMYLGKLKYFTNLKSSANWR